jgi:cell wall-associated NlpC family hydrolase
MTVTSALARVQAIQATIAQLNGPAATSATGAFGKILGEVAPTTGTTDPLSTSPTGTDPGTDVNGPGGVTGDDVVAEARKYLGVPYVWGGTDPKTGLDCSGLTQLVYKNLGYDLPRVSTDQAKVGRPVDGLANAQPGDLLAFGSPVHHVGIYIGNHQMIEAPRPGLSVRVSDVYETPTAIRRILPEHSASTGVDNVPYADLFNAAGAKYGVDPTLLAAVAKQESGFHPDAVSSAGAQGLMQLMPSTAAGLHVANSFDPNQAVDGAARLLKSLLADMGSPSLALAAYNAGPGAVHRYHGIPPYPETQNYVRSVLAIQSSLQAASAGGA